MPGFDTPSSVQDRSRWQIEIPNQMADLMRALDDLEQFLETRGADANARYVARLAIEELGTNTVKYGYDDNKAHLIRISAKSEDQVFRIVLEDDGHEFNPCLAPEPDPNLPLQDRRPGGWGLSLVRRLVAGLEYERRDNRNVVQVTVQRSSSTLGS